MHPKRRPSSTEAQQDNTRKIRLTRNGPYNVFRVDNECLDLASEINILSFLGHQYSTLQSNRKDQMMVIMCIFRRFCTTLAKEILNTRVLVSYPYIVFMLGNSPLPRIIRMRLLEEIIHIRPTTYQGLCNQISTHGKLITTVDPGKVYQSPTDTRLLLR